MTGRELILYILANNLEDEQVFKDATFVGVYTPAAFAIKCNFGIATVNAWVQLGKIESVRVGNSYLIPATSLRTSTKQR